MGKKGRHNVKKPKKAKLQKVGVPESIEKGGEKK